MPAGNDAIIEAFADLLDQHGVEFVYSGDDATYTGLVGDGYSKSIVPMIQIQPGEEFSIRFLASDWTDAPERMKKLTADGVDYVITSTIKQLPKHGIIQLTCKLQ